VNNSERISEAYDAHIDALFRHSYFRLHDREAAKDVVQQTFIKTWEFLEMGNAVDNMRAFLFTVLHRQIIDFVRKNKAHATDSLEDLHEVGVDFASNIRTDADVHHADATQVLKTGLAKLPEPYKTAVILRYLNELSPVEIASILDISVSNASARISRGLRILRTLLPNHAS
jgi:RNA polymerase sigma-70 factor, ECF subfamily